jgi:hypothetical protein
VSHRQRRIGGAGCCAPAVAAYVKSVRPLAAYWLKQLRLLLTCLALSVAVQPAVAAAATRSAEIVLVERRSPGEAAPRCERVVERRTANVSHGGKEAVTLESDSTQLVTQAPRTERRRLYLEHCSWLC